MHAEPSFYDERAPVTSLAASPVEPLRGDAPVVVPPLRTIVVDRPPQAAAPASDRNAIRSATSPGPVRLTLDEVSIHYEARHAVKSVSLSIHQGEVLALIGPSRCGKPTRVRKLNRPTWLA